MSTKALAFNSNGSGGTNIFAGASDYVYRSTNYGGSWTSISSGLPGTTVLAIASIFNGTGGTNLFAGTLSGIYRSTNNGANWTEANSGAISSNVLAFATIPNGTGSMNIFAGFERAGIFKSTNNGISWTAADSGLTAMAVRSLIAIPNGAGRTDLFAGTTEGIFVSTDTGSTWATANFNQTSGNILALAVIGTNLFAATSDEGVWKRPLSEMVTSVKSLPDVRPKDFSLDQNYPNPFNPMTMIRYEIPDAGSHYIVTLQVYDLLGREVATLVNEHKPAGSYSVQWNASNLPSGIYFYRLQAGTYTETKKLVLMK